MYTDEKNTQILLSLIKSSGINHIVICPGGANISISASIENDDFFKVFSCIDERSAGYLACGISEEIKQPVVLSCTGATASRNLIPSMTEAFYRKIPIIFVTSMLGGNDFIGHLYAQNIDRTNIQNDIAKISVHLPIIKDQDDEWFCRIQINKAIHELSNEGGGPVHINLPTSYSGSFNTKKLPNYKLIEKYYKNDNLPSIDHKRTIIFIGSKYNLQKKSIVEIEKFCEKFNSFISYDHTSNYSGKYGLLTSLILSNFSKYNSVWKKLSPELIIHLGEVSGDYTSNQLMDKAKEVWRVSEDGKIRDRSKKLSLVYHGSEYDFFSQLNKKSRKKNISYYSSWFKIDEKLRKNFPDLPFSNIFIAKELSQILPYRSNIFFGILNSLRSWNFFTIDKQIRCSSNVGGFGIDGCMSTMVGAAIANENKDNFAILGDLAFFYDMNVLGNRHINNNLKILIVNNGCGTEFRTVGHIANQFKQNTMKYIAAGGHYLSGNSGDYKIIDKKLREKKSLVRSLCLDLGFEYISSSSIADFHEKKYEFIKRCNKSIVFECFVNSDDDTIALEKISSISDELRDQIHRTIKKYFSSSIKNKIKKII